ncbi:MAG TPA: T9SS type A sorting domain-containing protein [Ignavibacteria bacterium]|nr:T9SS type A sorting domain-containing protein [Ignavibacteria bacterium]
MKNFALLFIFLIFNSSVSAQDSISHRFFPLEVGNEWTYYNFTELPISSFKFKVKITKDSIIEGKKYFYFTPSYLSTYTGWVRYDSASTCLIKRADGNGCGIFPNDKIIDSLSSAVGRQINCNLNTFSIRRCILSMYPAGLLGFTNKHRKIFLHDGLTYANAEYMTDVGLIKYCSGEPPPCRNFANLTGCVLNGIVYGDTTLTNIITISNIIPDKFELKQNYPNPFNPSTNISFSIPKSSTVSLKVFDLNGKEVISAINNLFYNGGEYLYSINMSEFPSGVYYIKLSSENSSSTRKMILLK